MLCEACKKNEATVHSISLEKGEMKALHLCYGCACKNGNASLFSISDYISGFFAPQKAETQKACPNCNMTLKEFETRGRLGCGACYGTFAEELVPVIKSVQGCLQHTGKTPAGHKAEASGAAETARLKQELDKAVREENYELAAELRDKIKLMANTGDGE